MNTVILKSGKVIKVHSVEGEYLKEMLMDGDIPKDNYLRLTLTRKKFFFIKKKVNKVFKLSEIAALI